MILTHQQIIAACRSGEILINPFDEEQTQAASYDLRVGEKGATTSSRKLVNIKDHGFLALQPGDFGVLTILEEIRLGPQYAARFGLRSKYARKGLIATTGPQIDPGFHGRLIVGITNLTPKTVALPYKDDLVSVEFHRLEEPTTKPYEGPYQDRMDIGPEEIEAITEAEGMALSEMLTTLRSLAANVGSLTGEMKWLKWALAIGLPFLALGLAAIAILIAVGRR